MTDLRATYLGLELANPLVPSSSPLTGDLDAARRLEDAGAAAIIMPSLFEEVIRADEARLERFLEQQDIGHLEADSYRPLPTSYRTQEEIYLDTLARLKQSLSIPVIASLNGVTAEGWLEHALALQEAGADALELNVYYLAADPEETAVSVSRTAMSTSRGAARLRVPASRREAGSAAYGADRSRATAGGRRR
jgi:dihydroorotate dehydrogenase (fumarate)